MKKVTESVVLPCAPDAVWKLFLDEAYMRDFYMGELAFKGFEVIEMGEASRKLRLVPKMSLPGPIEKLVGDSFAYEDHATLDRAKNVWTWRMMAPAKITGPRRDLLSTGGTIRLEARGENECRRTDDVTIEGKVFGLGGLIEASAEKELRNAWTKEFAFIRRRVAG